MLVRRHIPALADTPVAATIGNFDGVHAGHRAMLARTVAAARRLGVPSCVLTFEPHPMEFFAPDRAPARLTPLRDKLELLEDCGIERVQVCRFDHAFAGIAAGDFIERVLQRGLGVRWLLAGEDFRFGTRRAGNTAMLAEAQARCGFELEVMPSVMLDGARVSSTRVRDTLAAGDMAGAERLLGQPYRISGRVVRGEQIGRKLGFPTANLRLAHNRPPLGGIYAVEACVGGGQTLPAAASLGVRPTVGQAASKPVLEVHALDFDGDLYGKRLRVDFLHKFRDERKYADIAALTQQIARDVEDTRAFFRDRAASGGAPKSAKR